MKTTYIYGLYEERNKIIRYVGKSNTPEKRLYNHLKIFNNVKNYKEHWIKKCLKEEIKISFSIIEEVPIEIWQEREIYWINFYKQKKENRLTNISKGGLGGGVKLYKITYTKAKMWVNKNKKNITCAKEWYDATRNKEIPKHIPKNPQ